MKENKKTAKIRIIRVELDYIINLCLRKGREREGINTKVTILGSTKSRSSYRPLCGCICKYLSEMREGNFEGLVKV